MTTQAYFENIEVQLLRELDKATESIIVAVAWFTNVALFNKLCEKCGHGVAVQLMILDDDINNTSAVDFKRLTALGGKLYQVGDATNGTLMHNKFCVIDRSTVMNGSYNWSYKARNNHENITVSYQAAVLAQQFTNEFQRLKTLYFETADPDTREAVDVVQVIRRLTLIQNLIQLGDLEDLPLQLAKLRSVGNAELQDILDGLQAKRYGDALKKIERYINAHRQVIPYRDPAIEGLRLEARALEIQLKALADEQGDLERTIHQFQVRHAQELGPLILALLRLNKEQATTPDEKAEAEADYAAYEEDHGTLTHQAVYSLSVEDQIELRIKYRQASKLCHPDAVASEHQQEATMWFIALQEAYEQNDLHRVTDILNKLEKGTAWGSRTAAISEGERLRLWVSELRSKVDAQLHAIMKIRNSETYLSIEAIESWDSFFKAQKEQLTALFNEKQKQDASY